jgi:hypothetical protein
MILGPLITPAEDRGLNSTCSSSGSHDNSSNFVSGSSCDTSGKTNVNDKPDSLSNDRDNRGTSNNGKEMATPTAIPILCAFYCWLGSYLANFPPRYPTPTHSQPYTQQHVHFAPPDTKHRTTTQQHNTATQQQHNNTTHRSNTPQLHTTITQCTATAHHSSIRLRPTRLCLVPCRRLLSAVCFLR